MKFHSKNFREQQLSLLCLVASAIFVLGSCSSTNENSTEPLSTVSPQPAAKPQLLKLPEIFGTSSETTRTDYAKAVHGDTEAQYRIGVTCKYMNPDRYMEMTTEQKRSYFAARDRMAFDFMARAAGAGKFEAQRELGGMYQGGFGTEQNYKSAKKWFEIALKTAKQNKNPLEIDAAEVDLVSLTEEMKQVDQNEKEEAEQERERN